MSEFQSGRSPLRMGSSLPKAFCTLLELAWCMTLASNASAFDSAFKQATAIAAAPAGWGGTFTFANLGTSNNGYATTASNGTANGGVASTFGFGVPTGAVIRGISVQVEGSDGTVGQTVNYSVDLSWDGTNYTTAKTSSFMGTTDVLQLVGGDSDTWGRTWTAAELSDANFRLRIYRNLAGSTGNLQIDRVRVNVTYDPPGYKPPPTFVRTGSYVGNGVNGRSITGLAMQPNVVIVTSDDTCVALPYFNDPCGHTTVMRTSTMPANVSKSAYSNAYPPLVDRIKSLDADGFSVGEPPDHKDIFNGGTADNDDPTSPIHCANHAGVLYYWVAFDEAPGEIKVGFYDGNSTDNRSITGVGFLPDLALVLPEDVGLPVYRTSSMGGDVSYTFAVDSPSIDAIQLLQADGFQVGFGDPSPNAKWAINTSGIRYHYVAWKEAAGRMDVGSYTGTGVDPLNVAGVGFQPEYLIVKRAALVGGPDSDAPVVKSAGMGNAVDRTLWVLCYINCDPTNLVQALQTTGFQVGGNTAVNTAAAPNTYYWMAFGGQRPIENYRSIGTNATPWVAGQVTVTNGSPVVSGISGTQWLTANRGRGDYITITGQGTYTILGVTAEDSLTLTSPFAGTGTYNYSIGRKFTTIDAWRVCVEAAAAGACGVDPDVASANLINDNRTEVGILYKDSAFTGLGGGGNGIVWIGESDSITTDATHKLTLTADGVNRHAGVAWNGSGAPPHVVLDGALGANKEGSIYLCAAHTHIEWIEIRRVRGSSAAGIKLDCGGPTSVATAGVLVNNVILHNNLNGILTTNADLAAGSSITVRNSVVHHNTSAGIHSTFASLTTTVQNSTVFGNGAEGVRQEAGTVIATNVISMNNTGQDFRSVAAANQSYNISQDAAASGGALGTGSMASHSASDVAQGSGSWVVFENITMAPYNLHLKTSTVNKAVDFGTSLLATALFRNDVDNQLRPGGAAWDIGADELNGFTAVKLGAFSAQGYDQAALVEWQTASELDNLGFHLHRASSAAGPWTRLNASRIPGLGSSPEGRRYSWADRGLMNGATYYYRLEDVDRSGLVTSHGPVSAVPVAGVPLPAAVENAGASEQSPGPTPGAQWKAHGDPSELSFRVLQRTARGVTLELRTGGFYSQAQPDGSVRLHVPGFFDTADPGLPTLPVKRTWVDAVVGRGARIVSVRAGDVRAFPGLLPAPAGAPEALARPDGTYRASFRRVRPHDPGGLFPRTSARVLEAAFQEQTKKAYLELAPLRLDSPRRRLVLARRLVVKIAFDGRVEGETSAGGSKGRRRPPSRRNEEGKLLVRFAARAEGLYAVSWESLGAAAALQERGGQALLSSWLGLSRLGQAVAFHVEPRADLFGPGSTLYFVAQGPEAAYGSETVYELAIASGGVQMPVERAARSAGTALVPALVTTRSYEQNTNYLPALLNARDLWLWDFGLLAPNGRDYAFSLSAPTAAPGPALLSLDLQGGSDAAKLDPDHQVRVFVNGVPVAEAHWDGLNASRFETSFDASILTEGVNTLRLENVDTTGAFDSVVYLDRFAIQYPRNLVAEGGRLEGRSPSAGLVRAAGFSPGALLLDVSGPTQKWLTPTVSGSELVFPAAAQKSYLAVSPEAVLRPEIRQAAASSLRAGSQQVDWIVIAPQELLPAAEPLRVHRESQGLRAMAVSLEEIQDEFGFGERSPQAIRDFLSYAYHHWAAPSPRYVLLLGDASSDAKGFLPTAARKDLLPSPLVKTTFLWTASDPSLGAVNGDDAIPDLAIGRLSAGSLAEAEAAIQKILAFETSGQTLAGNAVLVADNPDLAGDFEANANDIASLLPGRQVERIFLTGLGSGTRSAVLNAFDGGASLFSYVGHGSQGVWASEGILRAQDVALLQPQPRQPLLLTMTCSNGYFISPWSNALSERLVLVQDRGAIAAFSPSGLSLDDAAHLFHRALVQQLEAGGHERVGDLVLAAQKDYADTGAFPELLSIYHLFADPALKVR